MRTIRIKDIGNVVTGSTPSTKQPEFFGGAYAFIKPSDISPTIRRVYTTETMLSEHGRENQKTRLLPKDTTCIVCIGTIGKFCLTSRTSFTNQQLNSVIPNKEHFDPIYVFYLLSTIIPQLQILQGGSASGREHVNKSNFQEIQLQVHNLPTQRKIASILSAYDNLIENNTRRITILEEMAQAIYREWFVNFRFPGHENVKLVDSPLGQIPTGWEVARLDDVVNFQSSGTKAGEHLKDRLYLPIDCIPRRSLAVHEVKSWEEAKSSLHLFDKGDIMFGAMRPYFHKVAVAPFNGVTRKTCFVFKPSLADGHAFATLTLFQDATVAFANAHCKGATIPYAVWGQSMDGMPVLIPPPTLLTRFEKIVGPMLTMISLAYFKGQNLRTTRDILLPKLISGNLDVEDLDIDVGMTAETLEEATA